MQFKRLNISKNVSSLIKITIHLRENTLLADKVTAGEDSITVDGKEIKIYAKANAEELPMGRNTVLTLY